ncbi:MAG: nucleoside-diphosphate-sugar epimerase [Planctomycetota bacterium]|nr:nucleoside-diphosphate-sugar epimerase [Planctomycetota bacterium]
MAIERALITGATGLLGSHIAERLVHRGVPVQALVREDSDTAFLESLGVTLVRGDLTSRDACVRSVKGVDTVFHSAAKVGDWGAWSEFQTGCLDATTSLAEAAKAAGIRRFVHISSTSAYGHPTEGGRPIDETAALGQNLWWAWDYYTRSKVECERLLWKMAETRGLPLTVIRPSWLYGERDRTTAARLVRRLRRGCVPRIGAGDNPMSAIYAGEVAEAAILAAFDHDSVGEAYNVTDQGPITQYEYLSLWAEACQAPPIHKRRRYRTVFAASFLFEAFGRLTRSRRPPLISRYATWLIGRYLSFSTEKARTKLGWAPALSYRESIERTMQWYLSQESQALQTVGASQPGLEAQRPHSPIA